MLEKTIQEKLYKLADYYNEDIYKEIFQPWEKFSDKYSSYGKGFDYHKYIVSVNPFWENVKFFVNSDIPNIFYTMLWDDVYNSRERLNEWVMSNKDTDISLFMKTVSYDFFNKDYWEFFAIILACKDPERIKDVANEILTIYRYSTVPGLFQINCLVLNNPQIFSQAVKQCIMKAFELKDEIWLNELFICLDTWYGIDNSIFNKLDEISFIKTKEHALLYRKFLSETLSKYP